jgi:hypothetical protein
MTLLEELKTVLGERTDDDALKLIERVSEIETSDVEELKARINALEKERDDLDETWRARYRDRFFEDVETKKKKEKDDEEEKAKEITVDKLFKED